MRITYVPGQNEMGDTSPIRLHTELPSPETLLIARNELRETEERVKEATEELRRLLREDEKIYFRDDDDILLIFLRPTKFYPESALALMRRVAEFKEKNASVLKDLSPASERLAITDNKVVNVLIDRDQHGRRILVANVGGLWDTQNVSGEQLFRVFYLIHLAAMREPETQIRGVVVILDFENLGMRQIRAMNLQFSVRLLSFIQKAMPLRLKEVHIVKQPFLFKMVWPIFKQFIEEKLSNRLFFHGSKMESLHKHIDPDYLPADYGGNKPKMNYSSADWYPVLSSLDEEVAEWQTFGKVKDGSK